MNKEANLSVDPFYSESNVCYLEKKKEDYKAERLKRVHCVFLMNSAKIIYEFRHFEKKSEKSGIIQISKGKLFVFSRIEEIRQLRNEFF